MDSKYLDGFGKDVGEKFMAAIEYRYLILKAVKLPRLQKALRGWPKAAPNVAQLPMPEETAGAISGALAAPR